MTELTGTIPELARAVERGDVSARELTRQSLDAIEAGERLGAFLHVGGESALAAAEELDQRRARGEALGKLGGVPIALKDALCTHDAPATSGSRILVSTSGRPYRPPYDATVAARLRAAGAVLVGKTNMDEFAMGSSTENSGFRPALNPWDHTRVPGGSSGGSAVAVAAGMAPGSLGSDTGGSVRQPAAMCGVVGVKPSYGRVSRYGLIAFASSLDQVGPMANDVRGAARLLEVIAGPDAHDATASSRPVGGYEAACGRDVRGLKLGVPREYFAEGLDARVKASVERAIAALAAQGCELCEVELPHTRYGVATYYIVATAEASSNLARFDGVRFGLRVEEPGMDLRAMYGRTRDAGFGAEVKRRILLGTYVLSAGYYDAYYGRAQRARTLIRGDFDQAFERVDAIVAPTAPTPAFPLGDKTEDPLSMYLADVYTLPASLAGLAAISVPCEPVLEAGRPLPVGLQLIGPAFAEETLFQLAAAWESVNPSRGVRPTP